MFAILENNNPAAEYNITNKIKFSYIKDDNEVYRISINSKFSCQAFSKMHLLSALMMNTFPCGTMTNQSY